MKPSIERELEAIRQLVRDLESRLKNERVELGHRVVFDVGRKGEVPAPTTEDRMLNKVLGTTGWVTGSGSGLSTVVVDNLTVFGDGSPESPLSASTTAGVVVDNLTVFGNGTFGSPLSASAGSIVGTAKYHARFVAGGGLTSSYVYDDAGVTHMTQDVEAEGNLVVDGQATLTNDLDLTGEFVANGSPGSNGDILTIDSGIPLWSSSLSGSINAALINLSGTIDGHFNSLTAVPFVSVSETASSTGTLDVSGEGNLDWFIPRSTTDRPTLYVAASLHTKLNGGFMPNNFDWLFGGSNQVTQTTFTAFPLLSITGSDTSANATLTNDNGSRPFQTTNTNVTLGWGFRMRVPANTSPRTLKVYTGQFSCEITCTAYLLDGSGLIASASHNEVASSSARRAWTINYNTSSKSEMLVAFTVTTNNRTAGSATANMGFVCATLSGSYPI